MLAKRISEHSVIPGPDPTEEEAEIRPDEEPEAEIFGLPEEQNLPEKPVQDELLDPQNDENDGIITSYDVPENISDEDKELKP